MMRKAILVAVSGCLVSACAPYYRSAYHNPQYIDPAVLGAGIIMMNQSLQRPAPVYDINQQLQQFEMQRIGDELYRMNLGR